jgi:signal recognition particle receptor subunit beta
MERNNIVTALLEPTPTTIILTILAVLLVPLTLHLLAYRPSTSALPTFLLLGPSHSGKTTLLTTFASTPTARAETRTSITPHTLECDIPARLCASQQYRSAADPTLQGVKKFHLQDTPGHGKLRHAALDSLSAASVRGAVFLVDSAAGGWEDAAGYLHDVLLRVQRLQERKGAKAGVFRVLIACNKADLFTALPPSRVCGLLEEELGRVREAKSKGIVGVGEEDKEEADWLGEGGSGRFTFGGLEEVGIEVEFKGGSTTNDGWRTGLGEWIGGSL